LNRFIPVSILLASLMLFSLIVTGVEAQQPIIYSHWTGSPPQIDGQFSPTEAWRDPQLELTPLDFEIHTYVYVMNDYNNVYFMVDAANAAGGDYTEEANDHCAIWLHNPVDDTLINVTAGGRVTNVVGSEAMAGFGKSPNTPMDHRIYEFKIPTYIITFTTSGATWIHFASPPTAADSLPYDQNYGVPRVNIWPLGALQGNYNTWGILVLAQPPVGGEILPVNILSLLGPVILIAAVLSLAAVSLLLTRKRL